jgi:16S rRNA (guanine527-N7)-methyltransferase
MITLQKILADGISALALTLPAPAQQQLLAYVTLLDKWNRVYNLTAIRALDKMVSHHVLDSLCALTPLPEEPLQVLDVGSGGGMPGLVFAIARPQWQVTLLDSNHKKTAFLQQVVIDLTLKNVEVVTSRVERYQPQLKFDIITSRAFAKLSEFVTLTRHLLAKDGCYAALKGVLPVEEMAQLPAGITVEATRLLSVPGLEAERHLIMMQADM